MKISNFKIYKFLTNFYKFKILIFYKKNPKVKKNCFLKKNLFFYNILLEPNMKVNFSPLLSCILFF